ncbi:MAG: hypothetical protein QOE19_402, partial [Actinomycetota bacterium]|nr:hypothetical protein [Actinomycetota bacterium]
MSLHLSGRRARFAAAIALAALSLTACGGSSDSSSGTTATNDSGVTLVKDGTLTTCTHL